MAKMNSLVERSLDAAAKVALRPEASVALVAAATVSEAAIALDKGVGYFNLNELDYGSFEVIVAVNSASFTTNESYQVVVEVAADAAFTTPLQIAAIPNIAVTGKTGVYVLPIHGPTMKKLYPTVGFIRVKSIVAGTAPNFDYYAWML